MGDGGEILIVGGGIGGLAAAVALDRAGVPVRVFEQAPALHEVGAGVSLWPNAMRALALLGLRDPVLGDHVPLDRIVIRRHDGKPLLRLREPGRYAEPGICVHRAHLQRTLASAVPPGRLHLGHRLVSLDADADGVTVAFQDGSTAHGALLVGCDGIDSAVRSLLHGAAPARERGYEIWRAVTDFELPRDLLRQSTEWWGPGRRFGILPGEPGRVYWYATHTTGTGAAARADGGPAAGTGGGEIAALFRAWPAPVRELLAATDPSALVRTTAQDRPVPRGWGAGGVSLLGDAAHPMTPNMGQGACTAIEDAVVLARCVGAAGATPAALRRYEALRAPRTRWIVRQSRRIGRLGQLEHPVLVAARDRLMRLIPDRLADLPQRRVYGYRADRADPAGAGRHRR
jgi:2-polyprenyl-6-methoxyphenol hydroxylase-like FAD-dependent oxidoreductase